MRVKVETGLRVYTRLNYRKKQWKKLRQRGRPQMLTTHSSCWRGQGSALFLDLVLDRSLAHIISGKFLTSYFLY